MAVEVTVLLPLVTARLAEAPAKNVDSGGSATSDAPYFYDESDPPDALLTLDDVGLAVAEGVSRVWTYADGRPAAGVLSTNGLWWRYPSTASNGNRKRADTPSRIFLCHDYTNRIEARQCSAEREQRYGSYTGVEPGHLRLYGHRVAWAGVLSALPRDPHFTFS
jgi:hypothetical protein